MYVHFLYFLSSTQNSKKWTHLIFGIYPGVLGLSPLNLSLRPRYQEDYPWFGSMWDTTRIAIVLCAFHRSISSQLGNAEDMLSPVHEDWTAQEFHMTTT